MGFIPFRNSPAWTSLLLAPGGPRGRYLIIGNVASQVLLLTPPRATLYKAVGLFQHLQHTLILDLTLGQTRGEMACESSSFPRAASWYARGLVLNKRLSTLHPSQAWQLLSIITIPIRSIIGHDYAMVFADRRRLLYSGSNTTYDVHDCIARSYTRSCIPPSPSSRGEAVMRCRHDLL